MFAGISQLATLPALPDGELRKILPPTPVVFPRCMPQSEDKLHRTEGGSLVALLQSIQRPADINISHFEALGIHVIDNVSPEDLLPDPSFLPSVDEWNSIPTEDLLEANQATRKPLNNGNLSPGASTYRERQKELLIPNTSAFRTIRRIPAPTGETAARLGNAYEFFKNLEFFSGYWTDTSLPIQPNDEETTTSAPSHLQTHVRTGTGSQLPPDYRQSLLSSFVKLVAYDFGCNVSFPRVEPRLHLTPPKSLSSSNPPSYFNSGCMFVYRTPIDRAAARSGIVEGPVATLSSRSTTVFSTEPEQILDFAREIVAVLLSAQQRARENTSEVRFGENKWWTTSPRWGGGPGGPIGKEADKTPSPPSSTLSPSENTTNGESVLESTPSYIPPSLKEEVQLQKEQEISPVVRRSAARIGGIGGPSPSKRSRKDKPLKDGNLPIYEGYRKMNPPSSTWDRRARYISIGRQHTPNGETEFDDIFLLSALNHHISVVRARVPMRLLDILGGAEEGEGWERVVVQRTKWFDMFLSEERIKAMGCVWGVMAWLMREIESPVGNGGKEVDGKENGVGGGNEGDKMDLS